jgi:CheY-like chemotaxis protein
VLAGDTSRRILLVDDDAIVRMGMRGVLEGLGHEVLDVSSGEAALALLCEGVAVDALVTDYAMPGMDGAEVVREARRLLPGLPAVVATGYADVPRLPEGAAVLHKPFSPRELGARLEATLRGKP